MSRVFLQPCSRSCSAASLTGERAIELCCTLEGCELDRGLGKLKDLAFEAALRRPPFSSSRWNYRVLLGGTAVCSAEARCRAGSSGG